jgi:O-antigen/teichoic acid export membrane protein
MTGWLDRLNPALRHTILVASGILVTAILQYVQSTYTTWNLPPELVAIVGLVIPMALTTLTSITQQYGVGSPDIPNDASALESH